MRGQGESRLTHLKVFKYCREAEKTDWPKGKHNPKSLVLTVRKSSVLLKRIIFVVCVRDRSRVINGSEVEELSREQLGTSVDERSIRVVA